MDKEKEIVVLNLLEIVSQLRDDFPKVLNEILENMDISDALFEQYMTDAIEIVGGGV